MRPWLFRISLSHLAQYPGRTLLGILGIALGTAVYLSISLAAASALQSFQAGVSAVAATLNNIGPGLGGVGPTQHFGEMPELVKALLTLFMILGRLEFYAVVALLVPGFWRK